MSLKLITKEQELDWWKIHYNEETQEPWTPEDDDRVLRDKDAPAIGTASFGLRPLSAGDMAKITNQLYSVNRKGQSQFEYGTAAKAKVLSACVKVKNIGDVTDPEEEAPFTSKLYDMLPQWVADKLLDEINERNNLTSDEDQD